MSGAETRPATVLIVEDDPRIARLVRQNLEAAGLACRIAADGDVAGAETAPLWEGVATFLSRGKGAGRRRKGVPAEIIPLHGSIEVAPSLGLADAIVDITETGATLEANGLVIEEEVLDVSARLVVNKVALKLHAERLRRLIAALRDAVAAAARDRAR